jgi:hypothetical protein
LWNKGVPLEMNGNQSNEGCAAKKDVAQPAKRAACQQAAFLSPTPRAL